MADIFISYAREDETRIQHLAHFLEEQGWSVFWDRRIPAGHPWRSYIGQALSEAGCVIVAWTRHSIASRWVIEEAEEGQRRDILVPVLLEAVEPPLGFRSIQAGDLTDWRPGSISPRFEQFLQDIKAILGTTPIPPQEGWKSVTPKSFWSLLPRRFKTLSIYFLVAGILILAVAIGYLGYRKDIAVPPNPEHVSLTKPHPPPVTNLEPPPPSQPPAFGMGEWKGEASGPILTYQIELTITDSSKLADAPKNP
jgi:hypothetical protein